MLLKKRLASLRQEIESLERQAEGLSGPVGAPQSGFAGSLSEVRDGVRQVLQATSAPTALNLLLTHAARITERAVLFLPRKGSLWAWSGLGKGGTKLGLTNLTLSLDDSPLLASALQSQRSEAGAAPEAWEARLGQPSSAGGVAVPIPGPERSSGLLWFDAGDPPRNGTLEAVECLAIATGAALELIALRRSPGLPAGGRVTADESALGSQLPYSLAEEPASAEPVAATDSSAAPDPSLGGQHEDARRLARLLISEIKLYNEDKVALGRKCRDLYARLRDDIERSRKTYEERVSPEVRKAADYFEQELIKTLAEGDATLLGTAPATDSHEGIPNPGGG
jgi:hypothetical protein